MVRRARCDVRGAAWLVGVLGLLVHAVPAIALAQGPSLEVLETRALERHPSITKAIADLEVARGRAAQAGTWSNPMVGGGLSEWRPRETPSGTTTVFVEQQFTLGGKRAAARAVGTADVAAAEAALDTARLTVRTEVRRAYYALAAATDAASIAQRMSTLAEESVAITRQLINVGLADQPDLLEVQADAALQKAAVDGAAAHVRTSARRLGLAVGDATLASDVQAATAAELLPQLDQQALWDRIRETNPELRHARAVVARDRAAVEVEQRRTFPDLSLRAEAGFNRERMSASLRTKGWEYGVDAAVSVPLLNRNRGGVLAQLAGVRAAEAMEAERVLTLEARFIEAFDRYERARLRVLAYESSVIPRLEQAMSLQQSRYSEMATPYPEVLESRHRYLEALAQHAEARAEVWRAVIAIDGLGGTSSR